ncbi:MAG: hypothetical protein JRF69_11160 [Deltaproteobacteria bacterium]|nr:hypothetical protein [Deltaproteobacteria bacterium]
MIAKELYELLREVEKLEAEIESAAPNEREAMRERLRKLKAERNRMRKILDGEKVPPPFQQPM